MNNLPADQKNASSDQQSPVAGDNLSNKGGEVTDQIIDNSSGQNPEPEAKPEKKKSGWFKKALLSFWQGLALRRVFLKALTLVYALAIFGYAYFHMAAHRNMLSYMGVMLLMVIVYAEILVIRDHLWVIEGSMRESRRWRDIFFNQTNLRRQRLRKILSLLFALCVFSYMYFKAGVGHKPVLSFMGVMLMMTVLYYEILTIRDEIFVMGQSLQSQPDSISEDRKQHYDQFLEQAGDDSKNGEKSSEPPSDQA